MKPYRLVLALALLLSTACSTRAPTPTEAVPDQSSYTIRGVAVVDVENGVLLLDQTVIITGERISKVGPRSKVAAPKGSRVLDGSGLYLMPGLIDAHVHYYDPAVWGGLMLANGVVLVRDMGQPTDQVLKLRQELNQGTLLGPEMIATGWILDGEPPLIPPVSIGLATPERAREAVRAQAQAGVDQIKVYSGLDRELLVAIAEEARLHSLKVVGHVPEAVYVEDAIAAGQSGIEHLHGFDKLIGKLLRQPITLARGGMGVDFRYWPRLGEVDHDELQKALRRLAATGVTVCPTVIVFKVGVNLQAVIGGEHVGREYISAEIRDVWKTMWGTSQQDIEPSIWQAMASFVRELHQAGVTLIVGTDLLFPGIIPGFAVHDEMAIWQDAGIPAADILRSATIVPARFMGLDGRLGSVAEGKAASLVLVRANPLQDIRNAQQIEGVFLRGQYFNRDDLNRLLEGSKELAQQ